MTTFLLYATPHFTISQASGYRVPGYVIVEAKSGATALAAFTADEAADLLHCLTVAEVLVQALFEPERIYVMKFGEMVPRVHFHVVPRTARIGAAYAAEVADDPPFNGARLVDWIWNRHASLGFTDDELAAFVIEARAWLTAHVADA